LHQDATHEPLDVDLLVQKAKAGDAEAFGRLYDMHVDRVYRHIYYRINNVADTEDLTQQVFLKAWRAIPRYKKTTSPFIAWLMTISHNLVIDFYRAKKDKIRLQDGVVAEDPKSSPEAMAQTHFDQEKLRMAIAQLHGDQQRVVLMRFIEGFSFAETADSLGKTEGATRVILHRALKKLRHILEAGRGQCQKE
jgi:RNA polymerase sigma-70 factor (ECF subfamily)